MIFRERKVESYPQTVKMKAGDKLELSSGRYEVKSFLGQGGFGTVYEIFNSTGTHFALKVLDLTLKMQNEWEGLVKRFQQGFEVGRTESTYLVRNFFEGQLEGNPYVIMEYCSNGNLSIRFDMYSQGSDYKKLGVEILRGLSALHLKGIVHRDMKPENILFDESDQAKLSDYDISAIIDKRMTTRNWFGSSKEVWGTYPYCPYEQLDPRKGYKATNPTMDMFAFGVTLYECITGGCLPYGSFMEVKENPISYYEKIRQGKFTPIQKYRPDVEISWMNLIHKCVDPNPENRFSDAGAALNYLGISTNASEAPAGNGSASLTIMNGLNVGTKFDLEALRREAGKKSLNLGYQGDNQNHKNDIPLEESATRYISRRHATLITTNGQWLLIDGQKAENQKWKQSLNGTVVNHTQIKGSKESFPLSSGDFIYIGENLSMKFEKE